MAVVITDTCINCDACIDECPATAIVSADEFSRKRESSKRFPNATTI